MKKQALLFGGTLWLAVLLSSCVSPFSKIDHPAQSFARPAYSISTPPGEGWEYRASDSRTRYKLIFFKTMSDPQFHSLAAGVIETPNSAEFETPEEFEQWIKKTMEASMSSDRQRLLDNQLALDKEAKFGAFTVKFYTRSEDHRIRTAGNAPCPILVQYGYVFVHPSIPNRIVKVAYSERGRPHEIRPEAAKEAEIFFNGIELRKTAAADGQ